MTPEEKLTARKFNEQTKLSATAVNAAAIALLGGAIIISGVNNPFGFADVAGTGFVSRLRRAT